jgi:hypothetical protein
MVECSSSNIFLTQCAWNETKNDRVEKGPSKSRILPHNCQRLGKRVVPFTGKYRGSRFALKIVVPHDN